MLLREGGDTDAEVPELADHLHQLGGVGQPLRVRLPRLPRPAGHVATEGEDVADAGAGEAADDPAQLGSAVSHGCEVTDRGDGRLGGDALDDAQRTVPRGAAGAVGHGDEGGREDLELTDRLPELPLPLVRLRREELEGKGGLAGGE